MYAKKPVHLLKGIHGLLVIISINQTITLLLCRLYFLWQK